MIIALSGKINSGKNLFAKVLQYELASLKDSSVQNIPLSQWDDNCIKLSEISGFENKSFANKIKMIASIIIGCDPSLLENQTFKESHLGGEWNISDEQICDFPELTKKELTPRFILQKLGTDICRNLIHPNIWINALFADYQETDGSFPNWIVTDMRFPNDDARIKELGGFRIRIERETAKEDDTTHNHSSECGLDHIDDFDIVIDNNQKIRELHIAAKEIIEKLM